MPRKKQQKRKPAFRPPRPRMRMPPVNAQMKLTTDVMAGGAMLILGTGVLGMAKGALPPAP